MCPLPMLLGDFVVLMQWQSGRGDREPIGSLGAPVLCCCKQHTQHLMEPLQEREYAFNRNTRLKGANVMDRDRPASLLSKVASTNTSGEIHDDMTYGVMKYGVVGISLSCRLEL